MSFVHGNTGSKVYAPGWFLANNEDCTRETKQISASDGRVVTADGGKYFPMGSVYPTNDAYAIGITYEDVDVTTGNTPGSVVTAGTVYENRLAKTGVDYEAVTPASGDNPKAKGWYERSGASAPYTWTLSNDTSVNGEKTYYEQYNVTISSAAKSALQGLGFKFVDEPTVTRPY